MEYGVWKDCKWCDACPQTPNSPFSMSLLSTSALFLILICFIMQVTKNKIWWPRFFTKGDKCGKTAWNLAFHPPNCRFTSHQCSFFSAWHLFYPAIDHKNGRFCGQDFLRSGKAVNGVRIPVVRPTLNPCSAFGAQFSRRRRRASPTFNSETTAWKIGPRESAVTLKSW